MTAQLLAAPYSYFADANGAPLASGKIFTYIAGTTTPQAAYTDSGAGTPLSNPVILDSAGRAQIWLSGFYKIVVQDSLGNVISTADNITATGATGDMNKSVYDPAAIGEQLVGLTATQTLTNKTLLSPIIQTQTPATPQGRLTLVSGSSVMTSDQVAATTIYYTPHNGVTLPLFDGSNFINKQFGEISLVLNSTNHPNFVVFDVYASLQAGVVTLSAMAWSNSGVIARSSSAGGKTSTGNATIVRKNGIWVNAAIIAATDSFNNTTGIAIPINQGTYLGTFYTTGNGQTGVALRPTAASGGTANIVGLWNAYNRVKVNAISRDSTSTWSYSTGTWRQANNSASNRISWVDGLQQTNAKITYNVLALNICSAGVAFDSATVPTAEMGINITTGPISVSDTTYPLLGFHFAQALEFGGSSGTFTGTGGTGGSQAQALILELEI